MENAGERRGFELERQAHDWAVLKARRASLSLKSALYTLGEVLIDKRRGLLRYAEVVEMNGGLYGSLAAVRFSIYALLRVLLVCTVHLRSGRRSTSLADSSLGLWTFGPTRVSKGAVYRAVNVPMPCTIHSHLCISSSFQAKQVGSGPESLSATSDRPLPKLWKTPQYLTKLRAAAGRQGQAHGVRASHANATWESEICVSKSARSGSCRRACRVLSGQRAAALFHSRSFTSLHSHLHTQSLAKSAIS